MRELRAKLEPEFNAISLSEQCRILGINRSGYYYKPVGESEENLSIMLLIDKQYLLTPFYGVRKMQVVLRSMQIEVNIKRVRRLMQLMGLETIYCKPNLSRANKEHKKYPYLLRDVLIDRIDQAWGMDITYMPMRKGFLYLAAVIDWHSRYVLSWRLSNTLEGTFCIDALEEALSYGTPEIFNTDQGVQFTSERFTGKLLEAGIKISMDGRRRAIDNVFVERLWRTIKYEYLYLNSQEDGKELYFGLKDYLEFYNKRRPHQSLNYRMPWNVYFNC